jgi:hypothetical protein
VKLYFHHIDNTAKKANCKTLREPCKPNIKNPFHQILVLTLKIIHAKNLRVRIENKNFARSDIMAKIEKTLEGPNLGSCRGTSKLKIKNPFYQIQVHVLK